MGRVEAVQPLYASERSAARLLDMRPAEFRALVEAGVLPRPVCIAGKIERWKVSMLDDILSGKIIRPDGAFDL